MATEQRLFHFDHRLLGIAARTIGVLLGWKIGIENRIEHQHRCCHAYPIAQSRHGELLSSPGWLPSPGPLRNRMWGFPPSGSSADVSCGRLVIAYLQIDATIRAWGRGRSSRRSANLSPLRRARWRQRSYSALRLPALRRPKLWFPSLGPTCIRFALLQDRQGLPDDWPTLLSTRRGRTPRRLRYPLDRHASSAAAFQQYDALGTGKMMITRLHSHGSHSRVPTHQRSSYLTRCKARYRPAGLRFGRAGFAPAG